MIVPVEPNTKSQSTHSGCHKAALISHAPSVERACEKQIDRKRAACSHCAQALPIGQELEVGPFTLEPNTKSQNTHSGCHKAALLSLHVQPFGRNNKRARSLRLNPRAPPTPFRTHCSRLGLRLACRTHTTEFGLVHPGAPEPQFVWKDHKQQQGLPPCTLARDRGKHV